MLRFINVIVLVLVLNFESFFCDLLALVGLVNKTKTFQNLNKNCPLVIALLEKCHF